MSYSDLTTQCLYALDPRRGLSICVPDLYISLAKFAVMASLNGFGKSQCVEWYQLALDVRRGSHTSGTQNTTLKWTSNKDLKEYLCGIALGRNHNMSYARQYCQRHWPIIKTLVSKKITIDRTCHWGVWSLLYALLASPTTSWHGSEESRRTLLQYTAWYEPKYDTPWTCKIDNRMRSICCQTHGPALRMDSGTQPTVSGARAYTMHTDKWSENLQIRARVDVKLQPELHPWVCEVSGWFTLSVSFNYAHDSPILSHTTAVGVDISLTSDADEERAALWQKSDLEFETIWDGSEQTVRHMFIISGAALLKETQDRYIHDWFTQQALQSMGWKMNVRINLKIHRVYALFAVTSQAEGCEPHTYNPLVLPHSDENCTEI